MRRKLLPAATGLVAVLALILFAIIGSIRSGLQRFSDDAMARFPGDRAEALIHVVDCGACSLDDRNHAVWALGQMAEERSLPVLQKYFDGQHCDHATRLCQYELKKALRMVERRPGPHGPVWHMVARWHQPWH